MQIFLVDTIPTINTSEFFISTYPNQPICITLVYTHDKTQAELCCWDYKTYTLRCPPGHDIGNRLGCIILLSNI